MKITRKTITVSAIVILAIAALWAFGRNAPGPSEDATTQATVAPAADSSDAVAAENQDLQPVLQLLNSSADVGHAFDSARVAAGDGDTLVVMMDTDKISTEQDQNHVLHTLDDTWEVKIYKDHHGGTQDRTLYVAIRDLAGDLVKDDAIAP
jgi:hypothetical protein